MSSSPGSPAAVRHRRAALGGLGLLLGAVAGWLAGLLRVPRPPG